MNTNWSKILLFSLIGFVLGYLTCHLCSWHHGHRGSCGDGCGKDEMCMNGGSCCGGEGHGMGGCMHGGKGSCSMGMMEHEGKGACCAGMGHGDEAAEATIEKIKASNFQGDTTVAI